MSTDLVELGFELGTGRAIALPIRHMAVTGQTQESGKTTTLEALVSRLPKEIAALTFVTKRGEASFGAGRRIEPYFRDRADWQFVTSILDATLQEKNKFLRPWIIKICRTTKTLADVQAEVRKALRTAKGMNEGVYTQLDAYLELIVPEVQRTRFAPRLDLDPGLNVMDLTRWGAPMQMLMIQSALDWINEHESNTVVVVPEAWEFIPEGKGSPVKAAAIALVRKGAAVGNRIWVDSQDMAGVDKTILRGCAVWLIGVQREANEIRRNLANIPGTIKKPTAAAVAQLERGQFYACWSSHAIKTYVWPAWLSAEQARDVALGGPMPLKTFTTIAQHHAPKEDNVTEQEARELREENERLKREVQDLKRRVEALTAFDEAPSSKPKAPASAPAARIPAHGDAGNPAGASVDEDALFARLVQRLQREPRLLKILHAKPALEVEFTPETIEVDGKTLRGRIGRLLAAHFLDNGATSYAVQQELARLGNDPGPANCYKELDALAAMGFLTIEQGKDDRGRARKLYRAVPDMTVNIREAGAR